MSVVFAVATAALVRTARVYQTATLCSMSAVFAAATAALVRTARVCQTAMLCSMTVVFVAATTALVRTAQAYQTATSVLDECGVCGGDGSSCADPCAIANQSSAYTLTVESAPAVGAGGTVYRFYVNANDATDKISAVFGNDQAHMLINTPAGIFNSTFNASWSASGINAAFIPLVPDLVDDSYATIGLDGPASTSGVAGAADPSIVEDAVLSPTISGYFTAGGTSLDVSTLTGGSWYVLNTAGNALPVNGRWLIAQITTTGSISGQINYQVFPLGVGADQVQASVAFDGAGTFGGDGGSDVVCGCTDATACNYDEAATNDDGSCLTADECRVCCGNGIADGACDCDGNILDECGAAFAVATALQMVLATATATFLTSAAFVVATALQMVLATATATSLTSAVFVVATASPTVLATATATSLTSAAFVVATALQMVLVTVTATSLTSVVFVVVTARLVPASASQSALAPALRADLQRHGRLC